MQVVAELHMVLRELLVDIPFITEETLHSEYLQLCGKELKVSIGHTRLRGVGMMI